MATRTVLCFGDSNTYGTPPMQGPFDNERHGPADRWPGAMGARLGGVWRVIEEGLPGRTTVHDDPIEGAHKNGLRYLRACLESHRPLDAMIVMLGTNDLKMRFGLPPVDIANGVALLLETVVANAAGPAGGAPRLIVVAPVPIDEIGFLGEIFKGGAATSRKLAPYYEAVAARFNATFFDAGKVVSACSPVDGVHYDVAAHHALGEAMAELVAGLD